MELEKNLDKLGDQIAPSGSSTADKGLPSPKPSKPDLSTDNKTPGSSSPTSTRSTMAPLEEKPTPFPIEEAKGENAISL